MSEQIKMDICVREESVHRYNMANINREYDEAFEEVSTYDELLELNQWAEVTRENEMKRFANVMRKLLTEE